MMFSLGQDHALFAKLFKRKDDLARADAELNRAIAILQKCGSDGWVEKYEKELAALS